MKTKLLTTALAAFALTGALIPDRAEAYVSPTWEQVGYNYGWFLSNASGTPWVPAGTADNLAANLMPTYGQNVAYYFYFYTLAEEIFSSLYYVAYTDTSYYYFLAKYYGYLYYWSPAYAQMLENYYINYADNLNSQYWSYIASTTGYYYDVSDYYYDIIFP